MPKESLPQIIEDTFLERISSRIFSKDLFLDFTIELLSFALRISLCILVFYLGKKLFTLILRSYYKTSAYTKLDKALQSFLHSIFSLLQYLILLITSLLILGISPTALLAVLGTLGIGIGIALKDNLSNFAGGMILLFFETYAVGDEVVLNNERGFVQKIDIFCTTILAFDGTVVLVPNGSIVTNKIINYATTPHRRLQLIISVDYATDLFFARKIIEEYLKGHSYIVQEKPIYTFIKSYGDSSINIELRVWVSNHNYWELHMDIQNNIKALFDKHDISIPFPQLEVLHKNTI